MSKDERKWLEEALKQYTFNDVDKLKQLCAELKNHSQIEKDNIMLMLDEVLELVELHPRNGLNICLCGGMQTMLDIIVNNPIEDARRDACSIFSFCC